MSKVTKTKSINFLAERNQHVDKVNPQYFNESANTLFNFMKRFEFLEMVIRNLRIVPRYSVEDISYLNLKSEVNISNIAMPMLCFCDINLHQIQTHITSYGSFGIGISKQWGSEVCGIQPVNYINPASPLRDDMRLGLQEVFREHSASEDANALLTQLKFSKPLYGKMRGVGDKNFHDEHEWRYIPKIDGPEAYNFLHDGAEYYGKWMKDDSIMDRLSDGLRDLKRDCSIRLTPDAINYIFVENNDFAVKIIEDIDELNIEKETKHLLMSKIINLEQLKGDW
ncbi:hypothetical protein MUDAN_DOGOELCO_01779 [Lactiplantibacillus mudanjiangensis]|uniref:abortive infection system antitoxin AbiGi family protein n=1 Tax=Lactiplantibacillus mudanjiangensis TaxID=1296538 RepID=UPI001013F753|nr:abortive infection system antitoxin AbiGi family protein [Lactiplantibacillus mudanjiangensis]VDG32523.1 hypothetical protein MUDAN_DOGOELCO_01779 [Lactiplantibacillus mudanjiangensis]